VTEPPKGGFFRAWTQMGGRDYHSKMDWMTQSLCRNNPPDYWFPPLDCPSANWPGTKVARQICSECPVIEECREYAYDNEPHGTWAGETAEERVARRIEAGLKALPGAKYGVKLGRSQSHR
jgi:WhiB family redox-sensing transcriptional regulator